MASATSLIMVVLVIFNLVLLLKWQHVRRPEFFSISWAAIILNIILVGIFSQFSGRWAIVLAGIFNMVFTIIALGSAIMTCYQGEFPISCSCTKKEDKPAGSDAE